MPVYVTTVTASISRVTTAGTALVNDTSAWNGATIQFNNKS